MARLDKQWFERHFPAFRYLSLRFVNGLSGCLALRNGDWRFEGKGGAKSPHQVMSA